MNTLKRISLVLIAALGMQMSAFGMSWLGEMAQSVGAFFSEKVETKPSPEEKLIVLFLKKTNEFISVARSQWEHTTWFGQEEPVAPGQQFTFVQKKQIPNTANIKFATDIHGNKKIFYSWLKNLQKEGFLDETSLFKIKQENGYIVLLGDYIDRGKDSMEVLIAIMTLFIENPGKVIILRGNHEDKDLYDKNNFLNNNTAITLANKVFDLLPSACYLTWENDQKQEQCLLCVHGGPNLNYNPQNLLNYDDISCYEWVPHIPIKKTKYLPNIYENYQHNLFTWVDIGDSPGTTQIMSGRAPITHTDILNYLQQTTPENIHMLGIVRGHQNAPGHIEILDKQGIEIFRSPAQFSQDRNQISLADLDTQPFFITLGSFIQIEHSSYEYCHNTALSLQLSPTLKNSFFLRQDINPAFKKPAELGYTYEKNPQSAQN